MAGETEMIMYNFVLKGQETWGDLSAGVYRKHTVQ